MKDQSEESELILLSLKIDQPNDTRIELTRAQNRERIAVSKLNCLKGRHQKLTREMEVCRTALEASQNHHDHLQKRLNELHLNVEEAQRTADAWRAKAYQQMDELEMAQDQISALERELEMAWERCS